MRPSRVATIEDINDCREYVERTTAVVREIARYIRDADQSSKVHRAELVMVLDSYAEWLNDSRKPALIDFQHAQGEQLGL